MSAPQPPAGWYDDPSDARRLRYWDGTGWTEQVSAKVAPATVRNPSVAAGRTDGGAIAALVLGITGIVAIPFIPAVVAIVLGTKARTRIQRSGGALQGESMATAGLVLGIFGTVWGIFITAVLTAIAIPVFLNQRAKGWESQVESTLANMAIAEDSWLTANASYTTSLEDLTGEGLSYSEQEVLPEVVAVQDADYYCLKATSAHDRTIVRYYDSASGRINRAGCGYED